MITDTNNEANVPYMSQRLTDPVFLAKTETVAISPAEISHARTITKVKIMFVLILVFVYDFQLDTLFTTAVIWFP